MIFLLEQYVYLKFLIIEHYYIEINFILHSAIIAFLMFSPSSPQQKELVIGYKPIIELLSFYYSAEFHTLTMYVPDVKYVFEQHKMLLSQVLALMVSAGIKMSKARKESLRPLFAVPGVLRQVPTTSAVFGEEDLAAIGERTAKEQATLRKIFRPMYPKAKFRGAARLRGRFYNRQ